ncbi:MAG: hypothetical protein J7497_08210 [Chitinophagaceae bacterium]|nr:hypothetical protein [Chitinophagaceae bacterium]
MKIKGFIEVSLLIGGILSSIVLHSQELYVFSEPASNMPAGSISAKATGRFVKSNESGKLMQRYTPEIMLGLNKNWMLHGAVSFSDMFSSNLRWESAKFYAKYRFLSNDDVHKHFRMAAFGEVSYSRNDPVYNELSFEGDQSGIQTGIIATQLLHKLALSASGSYLLYAGKKFEPKQTPYQAVNYNLSAGYLLLPFRYTSFKQTNLNLYTELLGQQSLDLKGYYIDLAPAIQFIFNSNTKLNLGYRWQLNGDMYRMGQKGWLISLETTFLNALK